MNRKVGIGLAAAGVWTALVICIVSGCTTMSGGGNSASAGPRGEVVQEPDDDPSTGGSDVSSSSETTNAAIPEPASPFEKANKVPFDASVVTIEGRIDSVDDVDIYNLGPAYRGERLVVDVQAIGDLDAVAAVFDEGENLIYANDDRAYYAQLINPKIDTQLRRSCARLYVAVASSLTSGTTGDYVVTVSASDAGTPPEPDRQLVYLNFDGANAVRIGNRPAVEIPPFEGSRIGPAFADDTEALINRVVTLVREDYTALNVEFVSSHESSEPAEPHTTVHFGAYDANLLGVADNVDEYNEHPVQQAIVFVDTFQAFLGLDPSVEEMALALANVAAHEAGHLLGLQHTHDPREIMDISATLRQMLAPQAFMQAPLDAMVFPVGNQDSAQTLVDALGGDVNMLKLMAAQQLTHRTQWYDEGGGPPAREVYTFSASSLSK